ncbi:retrovirus-related Pol polyprotein from transposon 412 [Trichonephila clavipes]|nr:retrovirus-related Pol polyprotein from transposon 412 [Trichonephila clavipes]
MKTLQEVRERFYWNNVRSEVEKCFHRCDPCAAHKGLRKRTRGRLQLYNVGAPFERIAFDILDPLSRSLEEIFESTSGGKKLVKIRWPINVESLERQSYDLSLSAILGTQKDHMLYIFLATNVTVTER